MKLKCQLATAGAGWELRIADGFPKPAAVSIPLCRNALLRKAGGLPNAGWSRFGEREGLFKLLRPGTAAVRFHCKQLRGNTETGTVWFLRVFTPIYAYLRLFALNGEKFAGAFRTKNKIPRFKFNRGQKSKAQCPKLDGCLIEDEHERRKCLDPRLSDLESKMALALTAVEFTFDTCLFWK